MKVKELIEKLLELDPKADVIVETPDTTYMVVMDIETEMPPDGDPEVYLMGVWE